MRSPGHNKPLDAHRKTAPSSRPRDTRSVRGRHAPWVGVDLPERSPLPRPFRPHHRCRRCEQHRCTSATTPSPRCPCGPLRVAHHHSVSSQAEFVTDEGRESPTKQIPVGEGRSLHSLPCSSRHLVTLEKLALRGARAQRGRRFGAVALSAQGGASLTTRQPC